MLVALCDYVGLFLARLASRFCLWDFGVLPGSAASCRLVFLSSYAWWLIWMLFVFGFWVLCRCLEWLT